MCNRNASAADTGVQQGGSARGHFLVLTENPGEAKVAEFDHLLFGDEDVFRFDVSMDALKDKKENGVKTEQIAMRCRQ